jgi:hypothetical protein
VLFVINVFIVRPKKIPVFTVGVSKYIRDGESSFYNFFYCVSFCNENNICVARILANTTRKYFNVGKTRKHFRDARFF